MTLHDEQERIQNAVNHALAHVQEDPWLTQRVLANVKGEEPMVKKVSTTLIIVLVLMAVSITALAAGIIYNQDWYYKNRDTALQDQHPEVYEAVMANLTENPEQTQSESKLVDVSIQDVSWAPEVNRLTISFRVSPKDPAQFELHGMWALDTDGAYIGEGGSTTATDDSEDRAMHWLWRTFETDGFSGDRNYGPPMEMMDDGTKRLLLVDGKGISLFDGILDVFASYDMFRTPDGEIIFVEEIDLDWLSEDYDQKMKEYGEQNPDLKEYAEERIVAARLARARLKDGAVSCRLAYSVVEYTEGMDDMELYTGGEQGYVDFIIRPKTDN